MCIVDSINIVYVVLNSYKVHMDTTFDSIENRLGETAYTWNASEDMGRPLAFLLTSNLVTALTL